MKMLTMTISLGEADARFILEALDELYAKWSEINRTSTDENVQAEYGMDAIALRTTLKIFEQEAVKQFGLGVKNISREPLATTPTS